MTDKKIHFLPIDESYSCKGAESVLEVALKNGIDLGHSCGGMGSCTTCRIFVEAHREALPPRGDLEQETAEGRGFAANERLACQLPPEDGMVVRIPETLPADLD